MFKQFILLYIINKTKSSNYLGKHIKMAEQLKMILEHSIQTEKKKNIIQMKSNICSYQGAYKAFYNHTYRTNIETKKKIQQRDKQHQEKIETLQDKLVNVKSRIQSRKQAFKNRTCKNQEFSNILVIFNRITLMVKKLVTFCSEGKKTILLIMFLWMKLGQSRKKICVHVLSLVLQWITTIFETISKLLKLPI